MEKRKLGKKEELAFIISEKFKWKKKKNLNRGNVKCMKCHKFICLWEGHTTKWEICRECMNKALDENANKITGININLKQDRIEREMKKYLWELKQ